MVLGLHLPAVSAAAAAVDEAGEVGGAQGQGGGAGELPLRVADGAVVLQAGDGRARGGAERADAVCRGHVCRVAVGVHCDVAEGEAGHLRGQSPRLRLGAGVQEHGAVRKLHAWDTCVRKQLRLGWMCWGVGWRFHGQVQP